MSRLRHKKAQGGHVMAGALSGVHRKDVAEHPSKGILPFKPDEEKKHGGKIHGHAHHSKLGRKRGGACHAKGGHVGQDGKPSHHGTDATPDRGMRFGTKVHEDEMPGLRTITGGSSRKPSIEDSLKDGGKVGWLHHAHGGKLTYQERKHLKSSSFVFPGERRYPIEDKSHARNALARVSQHGSESEKTKVRAAVHRKYPGIGQKHKD